MKMIRIIFLLLLPTLSLSLIPLLDWGKDIPKLSGYKAYFDSQIAKQAAAAVGAAIGSGKTNIEGRKREV
jgi:hypothetical protein